MTRVHCETRDLNLGRFFCYAEERGVRFYEIVCRAGKTTFFVEKKQLGNLLEISRRLCYTITVTGETGFGGFWAFAKKRFGLALGLIAGIAAAVVVYSRLWFIEIDASAAFAPVAAADLAGRGIGPGIAKKLVDRAELARSLERLDGVGSAQVFVRGCRLIVSLRETEEPEPPVEDTVGSAIVARRDCRITEIAVVAGTARVQPGQIVSRGQVLVEGFEGEGAERREVTPRALIYGEVWFTASEVFRARELQSVRTGAYVRQAQMLFGRATLWRREPDVPFARAERETRITEIAPGVLPLTMRETVWYELTEREVERDFETERPLIEERVLAAAAAQVTADCAVLESYATATREGDAVRITGVVRARTVVSV